MFINEYINEPVKIIEPEAEKVETVGVVDSKPGNRGTIKFKYLDGLEEHILYNADISCEHEIQAQWSGIKCIKCNGWYCA